MGCCESKEQKVDNRHLKPWELETEAVQKLCGRTTDPHKVALICQKNGRRFVDLSFPPCDDGIGTSDECAWYRPQDIVGADKVPVLYDQDIKPDDVQQGSLGDCWLICVLAILAQYPSMIRRICPVQYSDMELGVFRLRICKDGWWEWVTIDSFFPCDEKTKAVSFGSCKSNLEFWVCVLEKAYARIYTNYGAIVGGFPPDALEDLTGCRSNSLSCKDTPIEKLFEDMQTAFKRGFLLTTYTSGTDTSAYMHGDVSDEEKKYAENCEKLGIVPGHAYSVLGVYNYKGTMLVKLRNPWGQGEWKGDWGDSSAQWTADAKATIQYEPGGDDGSFWMPMKELVKMFPDVCICEFRMDGTLDDWNDFRTRGKIVKEKPDHFLKVNVPHSTKLDVVMYNQRSRVEDSMFERTRTYLGAVVYGSTDGKAWKRIDLEPEKKQYELPSSPHPYLVIPYQDGLKDFNNGKQYTIVLMSSERSTRVKTCGMTDDVTNAALTGAFLSKQQLDKARHTNIPTQENGLLPPTSNWNSDLITCPKPGERTQCLLSCLAPCCVSATLRRKYDDSNWALNLCCLTIPLMRNIIREGYAIEGTCVGDMCTGLICYPCALMQVSRELSSKSRVAQVAQVTSVASKPFFTSCYTVDHVDRVCCFSCLCPCISNAQSRTAFDGSNFLFNVLCLCGPMARNIIREGYHLEGSCIGDILCMIFCMPCSANQLRQEVDIRGPKSQQDVEQVVANDPTRTESMH